MSTEIDSIPNTGRQNKELTLTSFWGGDECGVMLQLTQGFGESPDEPGFIQLTKEDARRVVSVLRGWVLWGGNYEP